MTDTKAHHRSVRSYIIREGRLTPGQQRAIDTLLPVWGIDKQDCKDRSFESANYFENEKNLILEIGFGNGQALLEMAENNPLSNYIGIDVHRPGVGHLLLGLEKHDLKNVRVFCDDAVEVLDRVMPDGVVDKVCLFFPDPWPKKKHHKRRILQADFTDEIVRVLKSGGLFHFASDWQEYAEQALESLSDNPALVNLAGAGQYSPRPEDRTLTKFENRGIKLGHGVWDILMQKKIS